MSSAAASPTVPQGVGFPPTFWLLNSIEMFERLAFYTLRVMAPIYIMQADDPGGLHLAATDKGQIYLWWAIFQSWLPTVTGGLADRYGYKRTLGFAFTMMTVGYLMIALLRDIPGLPNFAMLLAGILTLATGTAFFKPAIQGSLAQTLTKENSSVGWSWFYCIVNAGAFIGHYTPLLFLTNAHTPEAWRNLFLASAGFSACNFLLLFFLKDVPSGASKTESLGWVLLRTLTNLLDVRLIVWLIIMSGFWMMMFQLWDLMPNFIADWVDTTPMVHALSNGPAFLSNLLVENTPRGPQVPQQVLLSVNSISVICGVVAVGYLTRGMRTLTAMVLGILAATVGILVAGLTMNPWILVLGIVFFSIGEMATGPKKSEYLATIAPPGKKALYLGYVNIPAGVGSGVGAWIAGHLYGRFGEKANLALRYLAEKTDFGRAKNWNGDPSELESLLAIERKNAVARLAEELQISSSEVTTLLWQTYQPEIWVWAPFAAIGVASAIALIVFAQMAKRWNDMNA